MQIPTRPVSRHGFAVAIGLLLLNTIGCNQPPDHAAPKSTNTPATSVTVVHPQRTALRLSVRQPGAIHAYEQTPVVSKLSGYVQKWNVDMGAHVSKGDILAELSLPEMDIELKQKEAIVLQRDAEIKQARETLTAAEASVKSAEAGVKQSEASRARASADQKRTRSQYDRMSRVGQSGVLDKDSVEEARYSLEAAEAGMQEVDARVKSAEAARDESVARANKARADIAVAEAHLEVAKANRDQTQVMLDYGKLRAPFEGIISRRYVDTGHFAQSAGSNKNEPLFVVERRDMMRVSVEVPEADAGWIAKGNKASIRVPALNKAELVGEVARTAGSLDRASRTLAAEIDLPNPADQLRSGMYAVVTISAEYSDVLTVPASAIMSQGDVTQGYQSYCFVINDGKATRTLVETGRSNAQFVEVLRLRAGLNGAWQRVTGNELIAMQATGLVDGQALQLNTPTK